MKSVHRTVTKGAPVATLDEPVDGELVLEVSLEHVDSDELVKEIAGMIGSNHVDITGALLQVDIGVLAVRPDDDSYSLPVFLEYMKGLYHGAKPDQLANLRVHRIRKGGEAYVVAADTGSMDGTEMQDVIRVEIRPVYVTKGYHWSWLI